MQATASFGEPVTFDVRGNLKLVDKELASAFVTMRTATGKGTSVDFGGAVDWTVPGVGIKNKLDGWVDGPRSFNAEASATLATPIGATTGEVLVSSVGVAACGKVGWANVGAGYKWGGHAQFTWSACGVGPYRAKRAARSAAAGDGFDVPGGQEFTLIRVEGAGAAPSAVVTNADGIPVAATPDPAGGNDRWMWWRDEDADRTFVWVRRPPAGRYTVLAAPGSVAIRGVEAAGALPAPRVRASVGRRGARRTLSYRRRTLPGVSVEFAEIGPGVRRVLGRARGSAGKLAFRPAPGPGGRRRIVAFVRQGGLPWKELTVARYVAPPPARLTAPKRLRGTLRGRTLRLRWRPSPAARRQDVELRLRGGLRISRQLAGRRRSLRIVLRPTETVASVRVRPVSETGERSRATSRRVAARRAGR